LTKFFKLLFPLLLLAHLLSAQNGDERYYLTDSGEQKKYTLEHITISNGLKGNHINDVLQDSLGFLWLASDNGLQRYDGYTFILYTPDSSDAISQKVFGLYEDKNENLWLQIETGLIRYRLESDDFVRYYFVNSNNDTIPYRVRSIAEDMRGTLWVWIQGNGLYELNLETKNFIPQEKVNNWVWDINREKILKEENQNGIYETWVTFPPEQYGLKLQYKFVIKRKNGTTQWENSPNPDNPIYGNRDLFLNGDTLILPTVAFNSEMRIAHNQVKTRSDLKSTYIKFSVNLNNLDTPLSEGDEIMVRGDIPPLLWAERFLVNCIVFDSENKLWIGTNFIGLFRINMETGESTNFTTNPDVPGAISSNTISTALSDQNGYLWFGADRGLYRYNSDLVTFENYFMDPSNKSSNINRIFEMKADGLGNIWTQSDIDYRGISYFNLEKKEFTHYSKGFGFGLSSITIDRTGIVWVGNFFRGLHKLNPNAFRFSNFSIIESGKDVLDEKEILTVYENKNGEIWIGGSLDGLYRYNRKTGKSIVYKADSSQPDSLLSNQVYVIFQDREGNFWIGSEAGLNRFDPNTGRFKHIGPDPALYGGFRRTLDIFEDSKGILWLVTGYGYLIQFNPKTDEIEYFTVFSNSDVDTQMHFRVLIEDPRGFLWIASANWGLIKFDLKQKKLSTVEKLGKVNITSLYLDSVGILWCGTIGQGLIRYDTQMNTKIIIKEKDGLLSNTISGLETDDSGNLWLSSLKGLSRYDPQTEIFKNYFKEDGFLTNEFGLRAHTKGKNGELIFGSMHGVVTFYPDSIKDREYIPSIVFTDFKIHNKQVYVGNDSPLKKNISIAKKITLAHDQNDISITFAALDFSYPERNRYSFYLENFEESWRQTGLERTAYYTNLDPGEYVFKVKGTNSDGVWNEEGASIKITVLPPWWQTWWAYTIYICVFFVLLYFTRRYELNRQNLKYGLELKRVETEKYQEIDRMKSRFFANISHEFRTPLTLILGPAEKILSKSSDKDITKEASFIKRNSKRLLQLVNQLLDLSKLDSGKLKLETSLGNIVTFVKGAALSFESLSESKDIMLKIKSSSDLIEVYFDREKMMKIMSNLLSNAFKFTPERGKVFIIINEKSDDTVEIKIRNTGIGIEKGELPKLFDRFYQVDSTHTKEHEGTGIGLSLTKELVELHHGRITVESEVGKWTEFIVNLPFGREHLKEDEIITPDETIDQKETHVWVEEYYDSEVNDKTDVVEDESKTVVLIIEDNYDMREYIKESLKDSYVIEEAVNGEQGVRFAEKTIPDLIISDLMMPKIDGNELTRILKNDERTSHIPIIILTAKSGQENKIEGLETGADDYLTKPFDLKELRVRVENLIKIRKKLQEKFSKGDFLYKPSGEKIKSIDEKFLAKVVKVIEDHLSEEEFSIEECGSEVGMSRTHLYKKIKALVGKSPSQYVRSVRLNYARRMVEEGKGNISEIAYSVGFSSPAYFSRCFKEEFGYPPSKL